MTEAALTNGQTYDRQLVPDNLFSEVKSDQNIAHAHNFEHQMVWFKVKL